MKVVHCFLSALRAVVFVVIAIVADKGKRLLDVVLVNLLHNGNRLDLTVSLEDFTEFLFIP
jgi:hypothetical protein